VLQCVATCRNVSQRVVVVCCSVLQCVAVCCSVLQCVAVCCSVLQCVAAQKSRQEHHADIDTLNTTAQSKHTGKIAQCVMCDSVRCVTVWMCDSVRRVTGCDV